MDALEFALCLLFPFQNNYHSLASHNCLLLRPVTTPSSLLQFTPFLHGFHPRRDTLFTSYTYIQALNLMSITRIAHDERMLFGYRAMYEPPPRKPSSCERPAALGLFSCSARPARRRVLMWKKGNLHRLQSERAAVLVFRASKVVRLARLYLIQRPSFNRQPSHLHQTLSLFKMAAKVDYKPSDEARLRDRQADLHSRYEFGGPLGVTAMMTGFPLMMCESLRAFNLPLTARELTSSLPVDERLLLDLPVVQPRPPGLACHLGL